MTWDPPIHCWDRPQAMFFRPSLNIAPAFAWSRTRHYRVDTPGLNDRGRVDGVSTTAVRPPRTRRRCHRRDVAAMARAAAKATIEAATQSHDDGAKVKGRRINTVVRVVLDVQTDHGVQEAQTRRE